MDLREKKTIRSITNAFLQLRGKKPLERITIKELSELAEISKATFYLHYQDIYDLSEQLQEEVIRNILGSLLHPEYCLTDPRTFTQELCTAFYAQKNLIEILFSGPQDAILPMRVEKALLEFARIQRPGLDLRAEMALSYTIHGGYHVFGKYKDHPAADVMGFVGRASEAVHGMK